MLRKGQQAMRTIQEHARREFPHRTVLPGVEPRVSHQFRPGAVVTLEDFLWIWEHDRDVQRLLAE